MGVAPRHLCIFATMSKASSDLILLLVLVALGHSYLSAQMYYRNMTIREYEIRRGVEWYDITKADSPSTEEGNKDEQTIQKLRLGTFTRGCAAGSPMYAYRFKVGDRIIRLEDDQVGESSIQWSLRYINHTKNGDVIVFVRDSGRCTNYRDREGMLYVYHPKLKDPVALPNHHGSPVGLFLSPEMDKVFYFSISQLHIIDLENADVLTLRRGWDEFLSQNQAFCEPGSGIRLVGTLKVYQSNDEKNAILLEIKADASDRYCLYNGEVPTDKYILIEWH